jgi:hypothetical protein
MNSLSKKELSTAYNVLTDLEFYMAWQDADKELIDKLHKKFYNCVPHTEMPNLTVNQIYVKKAMIISKLKDLSWTKN